jgi:photosystem II stability/assembly factor-like uncharacterized protein
VERRRRQHPDTRIAPLVALVVLAAACTGPGGAHAGPTAPNAETSATAGCASGAPETPGWSQAASLPGISPQGLAFADACAGIVVGLDLGEGRRHERGDIVPCFPAAGWTDDGGASVHFVSLPKGVSALLALAATDATHAWAAGAGTNCQKDGAIVQTSDGGRTWTADAVPSGTPRLTAIDFGDASHGWAVGEGTLLATADAGATWRHVELPVGVTSLAAVWFVDAETGWLLAATASGAAVEATRDAGAHWSATRVATGSVLPVAIRFVDASTGWVALTGVTAQGSHALVLQTTDQGRSWRSLDLPDVEAVRGMWFATPTSGWLSVDTPGAEEILGTIDGGSTWTIQLRSFTLPAGPLAFVGSSLGWLAGDGALYTTSNGGGPPRPEAP